MNGCSFCHDKPVANGRRWITIDPNQPKSLPCPRCGGVGDPVKDAEIKERFDRENMRRFIEQERILDRPLSDATIAKAVRLGVLEPDHHEYRAAA